MTYNTLAVCFFNFLTATIQFLELLDVWPCSTELPVLRGFLLPSAKLHCGFRSKFRHLQGFFHSFSRFWRRPTLNGQMTPMYYLAGN